MLLEEKMEISEVSEFSILPCIQHRKLGNLENFFFTSIFDSCCNLRCKNDKKLTDTKISSSRYAFRKNKVKIPRFPSFQFCSIPKIENSEILESVLLLQIFTIIVT